MTLLLTLFATFFKSTFALSQTQKKFGSLTVELVCSKGFHFIREESPSIYLYHHLFRNPFVKSPRCNHFAYLKEVQKHFIEDDTSIYYGTETNEISSEKEPRCTDLTIISPRIKKKQDMILEDELPVVPAKKKRYTIQGKNCYKVKKGIVLANWLEKIKINKDAVKAIEEKAVTGKDLEIMLKVYSLS